MGYLGHVGSHGIDYSERERDIRMIYAGAPDAESLLKKYGVEYAVVSPQERSMLNEQFFSRFQEVGEIGEYRLYKITRP